MIESKLTSNGNVDFVISGMFGKALCSYANLVEAQREGLPTVAHSSEYEATIRCLDMLVKENIYEIQATVKAAAHKEFGI
jgi:hypothetical protein